MEAYLRVDLKLLNSFTSWTINNIDESINQWKDDLSKLATSNTIILLDPIYVKEVFHPTIIETEIHCVTSQEEWRSLIINFIQETLIESDKHKLRKITMKAK